jgi:hypothetical protein
MERIPALSDRRPRQRRRRQKMHINDLHATMLYLLGLDHEKLTYRYSGHDYRLTDLAGNVAKDIVA